MSDEQRKEEAEVEAHRVKHWPANDEPKSEGEGDEVEAHRIRHFPASDEPQGELQEDDEVEAHVRRHNIMRKD